MRVMAFGLLIIVHVALIPMIDAVVIRHTLRVSPCFFLKAGDDPPRYERSDQSLGQYRDGFLLYATRDCAGDAADGVARLSFSRAGTGLGGAPGLAGAGECGAVEFGEDAGVGPDDHGHGGGEGVAAGFRWGGEASPRAAGGGAGEFAAGGGSAE